MTFFIYYYDVCIYLLLLLWGGGGGGLISFKIQFCEVLGILDVTYALNPVSKRLSCTYLAFEKETWVIVKFSIIRHFAHCYSFKVII